MLDNFTRFLLCLLIFFSKRYFRNTVRVSNNLDPDQARQNVGPDLGPNNLQKSDDKKSLLASKELTSMCSYPFGLKVSFLVLAFIYFYTLYMNLLSRIPDFVACEQQQCRSACTSARSDQRL